LNFSLKRRKKGATDHEAYCAALTFRCYAEREVVFRFIRESIAVGFAKMLEACNAKRGFGKWLWVGKTKGLLDGWLRNYLNAAKDEAAYRYEAVRNDSSDQMGIGFAKRNRSMSDALGREGADKPGARVKERVRQ
jgi:hypothetical protein